MTSPTKLLRIIPPIFLLFLLSAPTAPAQNVAYLYPAGGQQGRKLEIVVAGSDLSEAQKVIVTGGGVDAQIIQKPQYGNFEHNDPFGWKCSRVWNSIWEEESKLLSLRDDPEKLAEARRVFRLNRKRLTEATPLHTYDIPNPNDDEVFNSSVYFHRLREPSVLDLQLIFYEYDWSTIDWFKKQHSQFYSALMVDITIAPDATPGQRELYVLTPYGISRAIRFWVGTNSEVLEIEPNEGDSFWRWREKFGEPLQLPTQQWPVVFNGQIKPGDIDRFQFEGKRGDRIVIDVQSRSTVPFIANAVPGWFTAVVSLFAPSGRKLGYSDSFRFDQNPLFVHVLPEDGQYMLEVQDSIYRGRNDFVYRMTVGQLPTVMTQFPLGGPVNQSTAIHIEGENLHVAELYPDFSGELYYEEIREVEQVNGLAFTRPIRYVVETLPIYSDPVTVSYQPVALVERPVVVREYPDIPEEIAPVAIVHSAEPTGESPGGMMMTTESTGESMGGMMMTAESPGDMMMTTEPTGESMGGMMMTTESAGESMGGMMMTTESTGESMGGMMMTTESAGESMGGMMMTTESTGESPGGMMMTAESTGESMGGMMMTAEPTGESPGGMITAVDQQSPDVDEDEDEDEEWSDEEIAEEDVVFIPYIPEPITDPAFIYPFITESADVPLPEKKAEQKVPVAVPFPIVIYGRIETEQAYNSYQFEGKAQQVIALDVMAQVLGSALDAAIDLLDPQGNVIAANDDRADSKGPNIGEEVCHSDPALLCTLPEDGLYTVRVFSLFRRGGPDYFYRLRISPPQGDFDVCMVSSRLRFDGAGNAGCLIKVFRKEGFDGEITLRTVDRFEGKMIFEREGKINPGENDVWFTIHSPEPIPENPVEVEIVAVTQFGDRIHSRRVLAADDWEQAFIYHHLVPAKKIMVSRQE